MKIKTTGGFTTLTELLRYRAERQGNKTAYIFLADGENKEIKLTYGELDRQARAVAAELQKQSSPGDRALLLYPPGLEFISAFFGCLYAGVIAVPCYPPDPNKLEVSVDKLRGVIADCEPGAVLTTKEFLDLAAFIFPDYPDLEKMNWLATDKIEPDAAEKWKNPEVGGADLAFLQYTSGSTGFPKGVMVSHANILYNEEMIKQAFGHTEKSTVVNWLPLFHDMGLIGNVLQPLYLGSVSVLMSPLSFLQKPSRWLKAITRYKAHTAGSPNFGYDLCARQVTDEESRNLDLSSPQVVYNGAEPINLDTLAKFAETFSSRGFKQKAFYPCYGMAEATLFISGGLKDEPPVIEYVDKAALRQNKAIFCEAGQKNARSVVGCGRTWLDQKIVIVDPETRLKRSDKQVGEIWVSGVNVARGYWKQPELTEKNFRARLADSGEGPFLRTEDLGFMKDGELFVTGRLKGIIIIRGQNHYPQDIERTAEQSHKSLRSGCAAAFSIEVENEERLVVVQEIKSKGLEDIDTGEALKNIRESVAEKHQLQVYAGVLIEARSIPKTSSGKIQRAACKRMFLDGTLKNIAEWKIDSSARADSASASIEERPALPSAKADDQKSALIIQNRIIEIIAQESGLPTDEINPEAPFSAYGLDSAQAISLAGKLESWLGKSLSPTLIYNHPNIQKLSRYLSGGHESEKNGAEQRQSRNFNEPVAIIGMGCRFPKADSPDEFWEMLTNGVDAVGEAAPERCNIDDLRYQANNREKMSAVRGGFLDQSQIENFDASFFGLSPREAETMDPQQRLLMQTAWEALENAGLSPRKLEGGDAGVFIGVCSNDYFQLLRDKSDRAQDAYVGTGNASSLAANRLSWFFDWRGPSVAVDTACSSSLAAVHQACGSLRQGESSLALAGGVNLILTRDLHIIFSNAGMMSKDGRCKTFDADADGYVRGEGCGIVVLKRLSDAVKDGDNIMAVIKGSALNQDGRGAGLTAPNGPSQEDVVKKALKQAGAEPSQIGFVETHGTGTSLGDPIEVEALKNVLARERRPDQPCLLGAVKTNIGHLEGAAGIAGLIKAALCLKNKKIPANLHFKKLWEDLESGCRDC